MTNYKIGDIVEYMFRLNAKILANQQAIENLDDQDQKQKLIEDNESMNDLIGKFSMRLINIMRAYRP
ncbi:hypothetical protein EBU71_18220 [bacterium]|nr:hypothetical protein [Candidatus Elulimicrobium humile]